MKKLCFLLFLSGALAACNNSSNSPTVTKDSGAAPNTAGMNNVNGNVPDSGSGMTLNQSLPVDSSRLKDSSRH